MKFLFFRGTDNFRVSSMAVICQLVFGCVVLVLILSCNAPVTTSSSAIKKIAQPVDQIQREASGNYQASSSCRNCHAHIYEQFSDSMHAKSFENPLFQAEFFNVLLPRAENNKGLSGETRACMACHSPIITLQTGGNISHEKDVNQEFTGVECDLCHTIYGYDGGEPGNGNYLSVPGEQKLGPFEYKSDHHRTYSELQTKSEICAICHNRTNRYGLEIISTFSEWKKSKYAEKGIECQDCHMNAQGFLTAGEPEYESGAAAQATLIRSKDRAKLYTHRFPGAHSESQINGAIRLDMQIDESTVEAGKEIMVYVDVDNSRSGHKLPTGSAELRLLYLDVVAEVGGRTIPIAANSLDNEMFDISGKGKFDSAILGNDIPAGRRVYRAICIDPEGQQTLFSFDAAKIVFDNRLQASEIRKEFFTFQVPDDVGSEFSLIASLNYLRYPSSFAGELGVPEAKLIELASTRKEVVLNRQP